MGKNISRGIVCALVALLSVVSSCNVEDEYSTDYLCHFVFYSQYHAGNIIGGSVNEASMGQFVKISTTVSGNISYITAELASGQSEKIAITSEIETRVFSTYELGAHNALIVGNSIYGGLYAYDGQCPNCLASYSTTKFPLSWTKDSMVGQWVKCSKCGRSYDLNNSGVVADGDGGLSLLRYRAHFDGNVLNVNN